MPLYYTGVGSRETPPEILTVMTRLGVYLAQRGLVLRSGGADGADAAFEQGCDKVNPKLKQIFLPWDNFNKRTDRETGVIVKIDPHVEKQASKIAEEIHPAWNTALTQGAKKLHTRNVFQVLGPTINEPSNFLVGYATLDKNGQPKGGTRTAIKLAEKFNVRNYNLFKQEDLDRVLKLLEGCGI